jgi:hypothetical protein
MAIEGSRGCREKKVTLTGAQVLILEAWRGSARAANKVRPEDDFTVASPGAPQRRFHRRAHSHGGPLLEALLASWKGRQGLAAGVPGVSRSRGERSPRSPRRGGGWQSHLVEVKEGAGASILPKKAPARIIGVGRNRRATTAAIQSPEGRRGWEREGGQGWARSVWPTQTRASWFSQPGGLAGQLGLGANRPGGPSEFSFTNSI